jgi:hypothetical protein
MLLPYGRRDAHWTIQQARVALGSRAHRAGGNGRLHKSSLVLSFKGEHSPEEE